MLLVKKLHLLPPEVVRYISTFFETCERFGLPKDVLEALLRQRESRMVYNPYYHTVRHLFGFRPTPMWKALVRQEDHLKMTVRMEDTLHESSVYAPFKQPYMSTDVYASVTSSEMNSQRLCHLAQLFEMTHHKKWNWKKTYNSRLRGREMVRGHVRIVYISPHVDVTKYAVMARLDSLFERLLHDAFRLHLHRPSYLVYRKETHKV